MSKIFQALNESSLADQVMQAAKQAGLNPRLAGTPEQERERTQNMLAQRAKDKAMEPKPTYSPEQIESLKQQLEKAKQGFDTNYEYSDDHSYWTAQKNKAQTIRSIERQLHDAGVKLTEAKVPTTDQVTPTIYKQVKSLLSQLDKRSKQRIIKTLKKDLQLAESGHRMTVSEILNELTLENKHSKEVDYDDPKWDAMVKRVGQLAKEGPRKTVYDPVKRVYKTVPVNPPKQQGVAEAFGPLPRDNQQIRLGRHTVNIERVGEDKNYIGFAWHDSKGQEHYEEVSVGDLGSYDDLIDRIKQEISYQERQYTDQGVAEGSVDQLPTQGADYSKYDTDHLKMMLRPGILHRNEARFKALIRKELQKREQQSQQGLAEGSTNKSGIIL